VKHPPALKRGVPLSWRLLIYRVPTEPASKRVGVWRDLRKLGVLYLQQCVCIFPDFPALTAEVDQVAARIPGLGGETFLLEVSHLQPADEARVVEAVRAQRAKEYAEIVEECETKFVKEIEFEHFRQNYTFEEAEEIDQDLDKIRRWFDKVRDRDWFEAEHRDEVQVWLERCQTLLAQFEEEVYRRQAAGGNAELRAADSPPGAPLAPPALAPLRPPRARARRERGPRLTARKADS